MRRAVAFAIALAAANAAAAQDPPAQLGRTEFPTSGAAAAQAHFLRGALLLHSFEYEDAAAEFREAQKLDPDFAMAYWGEAMTYNHPLWMDRDRDAASKALARLAPDRAAAGREGAHAAARRCTEAVEILYADGEKLDRDRGVRRGHAEGSPGSFRRTSTRRASSRWRSSGTCEGPPRRRDLHAGGGRSWRRSRERTRSTPEPPTT